MHTYRIDFDAIPWQSPMPGVRFKAHQQDGRQLRLVEFAKGLTEPDWCRHGHIGLILEGKTELEFSGKSVTLGPGDGIFIPPGEEHRHKGTVLTDVLRAILVEDL